jgi:hypothetical protein
VVANLSDAPARWRGPCAGDVVLERNGPRVDRGGIDLEPAAVLVLDRS